MSVTEAERAVLRTALTEEIGEDSADILMRSTHPQGSDQLATKDDVTALATQIEGESAKTEGGFAKVAGEFAAVHAKMDGELKAIDSGFEAVNAKMDSGFEAVNAKMDGGFAKVDGAIQETRGRSESMMAAQTRTIVIWIAGMMVTIWVTLIVAFITLGLSLREAGATPPPTVAAAESPVAPPNHAGNATASAHTD